MLLFSEWMLWVRTMHCVMLANVNYSLSVMIPLLLRDSKYLIKTYYHACHYHCKEVYYTLGTPQRKSKYT